MNAWIPGVRAVMTRRVLVNFRVRPGVLERLVPLPFQVAQVRGWGLAGICLIRLEALRPEGVPAWLGLSSENAAHRIAVEWDDRGHRRPGVYILRRDTDSVVNRLAGGRLFPGVHAAAEFSVREAEGRLDLKMQGRDRDVWLRVDVERADGWPEGSVFGSLEEASTFFRGGCRGWSPVRDGSGFEGAELEPERWTMRPLKVHGAASSFFEDVDRFPKGTVELDSAILMEGIPHRWRDLGRMAAEGNGVKAVGVGRRGTHGVSALFRMP